MTREVINLSASIKSKLLNFSKQSNRLFQEILQYYAMERFLYRLSISQFSDSFVLKGGLLFRAWQTSGYRATLDIDLLGKTKNSVDNLEKIARAICEEEAPDGISFLSDTIRGSIIQIEAAYRGVRIEFQSKLDTARIPMQLDIGFGDSIYPNPKPIILPTILDLPAPCLMGYTPETVIAEKFETMLKRGFANSRMKDFYDIWLLSNLFTFESDKLLTAVKTTCTNRETEISRLIDCFSPDFYENPIKNSQWEAFIKKKTYPICNKNLKEIIQKLSSFLLPIVEGIIKGSFENQTWKPSENWTPQTAYHETH